MNLKFFAIISVITSLLFGDENFRIANYNVENLFDLNYDGTEYNSYIPYSTSQWNRIMFKRKITNISKVIKAVNPDILVLQEIESESALKSLIRQLRLNGIFFKQYTFGQRTKKKGSSITLALLSKFPITKSLEIPVTNSRSYRDILQVEININEKNLIIFVNHWKSKSGGESYRIKSAKILKKYVDKLHVPFIVIGDLNSNYNEFQTFKRNRRLNNTHGITGINHILKTIKENGEFVTISDLKTNNNGFLYNLWLELPKSERWSHKFRNEKGTLDNIIISKYLVDNKGIEYIPNSFNVYRGSGTVNIKGQIERWKMSSGKNKHHKGKGFSDHLSIYADFRRIDD